jgi:hypothetical protein
MIVLRAKELTWPRSPLTAHCVAKVEFLRRAAYQIFAATEFALDTEREPAAFAILPPALAGIEDREGRTRLVAMRGPPQT